MFLRTCLAAFAFAAALPLTAHASAYTDLHDFAGGVDGSYPLAALTPFAGVLFGTTSGGNTADNPPTIFRTDPTTGDTHSTSFPFGFTFFGPLLPIGNLLYGTAETSPTTAYGLIYSFNPANGMLQPIYNFQSGRDGAFPLGNLAFDGTLLYGATVGGSNFHGTLFSVDPATGAEKVLHRFNGTNGDQPSAGVTLAMGALFGTTYQGGAANQGEVFRFDLKTRQFKILHSFTGGADGGSPIYSGVTAAHGMLYGVTRLGGANGFGAVYRMDPDTGAETVLYSFAGGQDGASPLCNLVVRGRALYGTTEFAGKHAFGTVFRIDLATGAAKTLHSFAPSPSSSDDGPNAGLALYDDTLFGITTYGGQSDYGTVFKVSP